tara:strand:+ start:252 stop:890 length:639 start_codon:yes stop_codon:yes gene_type:complete
MAQAIPAAIAAIVSVASTVGSAVASAGAAIGTAATATGAAAAASPGTAFAIGSSIVGTGASVYSQIAAKDAADASSENQQQVLKQRQDNQRNALLENSDRLQARKMRAMAQVRASQAASGFNTGSGTSLAVFGEIESRFDDEINESTNQALDAIYKTRSQAAGLKFGDRARSSAFGVQLAATGIQGATNFASAYGANYDRSKQDPFGVFKKN